MKIINDRLVLEFRPGILSEIWKPLKTVLYNGIWYDVLGDYEISSHGNAKRNGKPLKSHNDGRGYYKIALSVDRGGVKSWIHIGAHRLVGFLFIPNDENKREINHKYGRKNRNQFWELEWATGSENMKHAVKYGLVSTPFDIGEANVASKYTEKQVRCICEMLSSGIRVPDVSKKLNIPATAIYKIKYREIWVNISSEYNMPPNTGKVSGEGVYNSKYTNDMVHAVCKLLEDGVSYNEICKALPVNKILIGNIKSGRTWKDISRGYDIGGRNGR